MSEIEAKELSDEQLKALFNSFDVDGNGTIEKVELPALLEKSLSRKLPTALMRMYTDLKFQEADLNNDGVISFEEFCALYTRLYLDPELPIKLTQKLEPGKEDVGENMGEAPKLVIPDIDLSEDEIQEAVAKFKEYDLDGSNTIDKEELKSLFKSKMGRMSERMIDRFVEGQFQLADTDNSGEIDLQEFIVLYAKLHLKKGRPEGVVGGGMPPMI